ncbi:glycosyltransferase [bacterium]|nr:glycosyltransferase [bacterium]
MKICDIVQSFTARSGGIRTYIHAKQRYLRDLGGHEHVLIMPGAADRTRREHGTTVHEVASPYIPGYRPYRFNVRLDKVARLLAMERPHVIELANPYVMPWAAFHHRRQHPCVVVGYYHADFPEAYVAAPVASVWGQAAGRAAGWLAERYARKVYTSCEFTVTASPSYRRRLDEIGVDRVHEVPLGVDLELFHPRRRDPSVWSRFFPEAPDGPVLAYIGRLDREKQVEVLVEAQRQIPDGVGARLFMMGEGPLRPALQDRAANDPRLAVQTFEADREVVADLLAAADLYVTAGPYETFGLSVLEAQASGLPVVGVDAGALPDRVPSGFGALVAAGDAAAMAAAIVEQLACDPRSRGLAARNWVEREFGWDHVFDRLLELYRDPSPRCRSGDLSLAYATATGTRDR